MPDQVSDELKHERAEMLIEAQSKVLRRMNKRQIGREITVLLDSPDTGRTYADAPDIDGSITLTRPIPAKTGKFIKAKIVQADGYSKLAERI